MQGGRLVVEDPVGVPILGRVQACIGGTVTDRSNNLLTAAVADEAVLGMNGDDGLQIWPEGDWGVLRPTGWIPHSGGRDENHTTSLVRQATIQNQLEVLGVT